MEKETIHGAKPDKLAEKTAQQHSEDDLAARVSRRRALIAGLAAAPAVLSLLNRSAWGAEVSCNLVASYVNAGQQWSSPRPSNNNGKLTISDGDLIGCGIDPNGNT